MADKSDECGRHIIQERPILYGPNSIYTNMDEDNAWILSPVYTGRFLCLVCAYFVSRINQLPYASDLTAQPNMLVSGSQRLVSFSSYARATLDKQSCVITSTLFEMNSTCKRLCDLNFSCLSTSITWAEVSSCQNKRRFPNPIWPTVFTFRFFKL